MNEPGNLPSWVFRFLRVICPHDLLEIIEGDLLERYDYYLEMHGEKKARRKFIWDAIRFMRPGIIIRNRHNPLAMNIYMLRHYLTASSRVLLRNKFFSTINILGLSLGITSALLLYTWVEHEQSFDGFHPDVDRIFKVWNRESSINGIDTWDATPRILGPTLANGYAGIEASISLASYNDSYLFSVGENRLLVNSINIADPEFLQVFGFPLLSGDKNSALNEPGSIVLTEAFAQQLFGARDAYGEVVTISVEDMSFSFNVTGILKNLPSNTDFEFEFLLPWRFFESVGQKDENWYNNSVETYVKLYEDISPGEVNENIRNVRDEHTEGTDNVEVFLYPLKKMHLYSRFDNGIPSGGRIEMVRVLIVLGIFLIVVACINFINLSTARAQSRSKEVAVRKVTGAFRRSLIMQFLMESILLALVAGILSLLFAQLILPLFNTLVGLRLTLDLFNPSFWFVFLGLLMGVGILAGSYPALYLSSFKPIRILKGLSVTSPANRLPRTILVVTQFGFAFILIIATMVVRRQIDYVQARESGYSSDQLVYQYITGDLGKSFSAYRDYLIQHGIAESVTRTSSPITERMSNTDGIEWTGKTPEDNTIIERFNVDQHISTTAGLVIKEGRDMDLETYPSDSSAALLNETAVALMQFDEPVGQIIRDGSNEYHIVGVVKDFIFTSPFQNVEPIVLQGSTESWFYNVIHMRLNKERPVAESLDLLRDANAKFNPEYPFEYHFVDEEYAKKFASIHTGNKITLVFTTIAIFIACLGLLGFSIYMIESKKGEISIRKILGGSIAGIIGLLSFRTLKPILLATLIFTPLAWWGTSRWLETFDYRINVQADVFLLAGIAILLFAFLTICVQITNAARTNPVNNIRTE